MYEVKQTKHSTGPEVGLRLTLTQLITTPKNDDDPCLGSVGTFCRGIMQMRNGMPRAKERGSVFSNKASNKRARDHRERTHFDATTLLLLIENHILIY